MPIATRTFRVFVSSTFEDLKEERDALQREVFPKLRKLCEQHGARFQAIDLRWGVRDEAALDQQTMEICLREIERCQRTGVKPNFIVLLGDRYGWRPLGGLVFGSAAWKCQERDRWIGWSAETRQRRLALIANNHRFLLLPWVRVPRLGSWILGRVLRRLSADCEAKYGHPIALVETFVERERFRGTVYRAANWQHVGATRGRTRQDRYSTLHVPVKDIYVYPLAKNFREVLTRGPA